SRLRRPTSKSMTTVRCPALARPAAKDALVVVFPTPPLPEVTTMILATVAVSRIELVRAAVAYLQRLYMQRLAIEIDLDGAPASGLVNVFTDPVGTGDRHQLCLQALAEDPGTAIALHARQCPPAQRAIDMNMTVGQHLGASAYRRQHDEIAACVDLLTGTHRLLHHHGGRTLADRRDPSRRRIAK